MLTGRRSEEGFTLVELLVTLVIFGIVMGALVGVLLVAIRVPGQITEHTHEGWEKARLTRYVSDDLASATSVSFPWAATRTTACALNDPSGGFGSVDLGRFVWVDDGIGRSAWYWGRIEPRRAGSALYVLRLYRRYDPDTATPATNRDDLILSGFCRAGTADVVAASYDAATRGYSGSLRLSDTVDAVPVTVSVGGYARDI